MYLMKHFTKNMNEHHIVTKINKILANSNLVYTYIYGKIANS